MQRALGKRSDLNRLISSELNESTENGVVISFEDLIEAAVLMANFELPAMIVAHRSRKIVSHSLPPERLSRLGKPHFPSFPPFSPSRLRELTQDGSSDSENNDATDLDPIWMSRLRQGVKKDGIDVSILQELAKYKDDVCARGIGEYALYLSGKDIGSSTVYRYVFLIASRLLPRLKNRDFDQMDEDQWEDLAERILDDDTFFHRKDIPDATKRNVAGYSRPLVKALRHFILFSLRGKQMPLSLRNRLPDSGLVAVDANFFTVDEYRKALKELSSSRPTPDTHQILAARVALILGYRCGLRRAEAAFLRLSDFDVDDHLHIRPWFLRKLKTANAKRDLPFRLLMTPEEFEDLKRFLSWVRALPNSENEDALLFCAERSALQPLDFDHLLRRISDAFHFSLKIDSFRYHHLRHSFANICFLRLQPDLHQTLRHLLRSHNETLEWIGDSDSFRKALFRTNKLEGEAPQAIALLMGHGSAATSFEHYIHVLDWYRKRTTPADEESA